MIRETAKRHAVLFALIARRERDLQNGRGRHRVLEEHLVKIAHPVEQNAIRMLLLDFDILFHRRSQIERRAYRHLPSSPFRRSM